MNVFLEKDGIRYELLDEENMEGAVQCVSEVFIENEPLAHHMKITLDEFITFARGYYPMIVEQGLSLVARDIASGEVIGIRVSEDHVLENPPEIENLSPKFLPIFTLLGQLEERFYKERQIRRGEYVHMFMVAVKPGFTCRGIAPTMNRLFINHVIELGYTHAVTEPTGAISQHILRDKLGFKVLDQVDYEDFEFEGERVFAGIEDNTCAMLMEKALSDFKL